MSYFSPSPTPLPCEHPSLECTDAGAIAESTLFLVVHPNRPPRTSNSRSQGRESQEQRVTIRRLEEDCARCEERAQVAEKTAEQKARPHWTPCGILYYTILYE